MRSRHCLSPFGPIAFVALMMSVQVMAGERPNLVFIIADDCTYLDMEIYGGQAKTPNLNRLAGEGMTFSRCFQAAPMCSPTRHNIYTGIYPVKSGAWPNHTRVYAGTKSIAHYLGDAGYRVALSGKTHIAPRDSFPFEYSDEFKTADPAAKKPYPEIEKLIAESKAAGSPFCLFACSNEPHTPYTQGDPEAYPPETLELPPTFVDTEKTRLQYSKYLAEISFFDDQCGALLRLLEEQDVASNTLVMVVSEQGSGFPFAKWTCFELGLTSGMIVRWPEKVAAASKTGALVEYCDIAPTFLEAAGAPVPPTMDGKSFLPILLGERKEHKTYTFGIQTTRGIGNGSDVYGIRSCGTKTHRYIRNLNADIQFKNVVTRPGGDRADFWMSWIAKAGEGDAHAKSMTAKYQWRPREELYDVANDPHCLVNLIGEPELSELRTELSTQLDHWMESQGDKGDETEAIAYTRKANFGKQPVAEATVVSVSGAIDGATQKCRLWVPDKSEIAQPLLVFLHSWSSDWQQDNSRWMKQCQSRGWIFLQPDFRGANRKPEACGSELAQQDILNAIEFVKRKHNVDETRVYLAGTSGGGHMAMLMAAKYPNEFAAVSAWCGISSLSNWYHQTTASQQWKKYAGEMQSVCGGRPGDSTEIDQQYRRRSPGTFLSDQTSVPIDINAGIHDGHTGSVPISQSVHAFNALVPENDQVSDDDLSKLLDREIDPSWQQADSSYGVTIHHRKNASDGGHRLTLFEGGHEDLPTAGVAWLSRFRKGVSAE